MDLSALDEEIKKLKPPKISSLSLDEEIANLKPPTITTPQTPGVYPATPEFWETPLPKQQTEDQYLNPAELTSMTAIAKAGLARQPETKIRIFAESRGIPVEKYEVNEEGDIVFQGPDNKWYREETTGLGPSSRRFVTEAVTDPVNLLATAAGIVAGGFTGGIGALPVRMAVAQGLGAAGGEYLRQLMAEQLLGEAPETIGQKTLKAATAGAGGLAGEALGVKGAQLGSAVSRTVARAFGSKTPTKKAVQTLANVGLTKPEQIQSIIDTQEAAKKIGISLNILEAAADNNPLAISALKKVAQTSPAQALERNPQLRKGVEGFIQDFIPSWKPVGEELKPISVSAEVRDTVQNAIKGLATDRQAIVKPLYEKIYADNPSINTSDIINYIDERSKDILPRMVPHIQSLKQDLMTGGNTVTNLSKVDSFKKYLDKLTDPRDMNLPSWTKSIQKELGDIKNFVVSKMDETHGGYSQARAVDALLREGKAKIPQALKSKLAPDVIENLAMRGEISKRTAENLTEISKIDGMQLTNIGSYILDNKNSTPQIVRQVSDIVKARPDGKEIWDNTIGNYINDQATQIPFKEGTQMDFGVKLWKAVLGDEKKQAIMKAALDPTQYKALTNLMDIYRRTGLVFKTTPTAPIEEKGPKTLLEMAVSLARPMRTIQNVVGDNILIALRQGDIKSLVDIIYDPQGAQRLAKINKKQNIDNLLNNFISIMGWTAGREAVTELEE